MKILDNITNTVRDDLRVEIKKGSRVSIAAACFSMYAYKELKKQLETIDEFEFIFTSPTFVKEKAEKQKREFYIPRISRETSLYGTEFEIKLRNEMTQRAIAKECADWIRRKATFKSNTTGENMAGFMTVDSGAAQTAYMPIGGFTTVDIGCERGNNSYNMVNCMEAPFAQQYMKLFDSLWNDRDKMQDVTDVVLENISTAYAENSPEFIYFMTLYHTISNYYGNAFDSCRYLDRFFDLRISLPPANMYRYYQSINFQSDYYTVDVVCKKIIELFHFSLREISRYLKAIKIAEYELTHSDGRFDFSDPEGLATRFCTLYMVPLLIALEISDVTSYNQLISGHNPEKLIELLECMDSNYKGHFRELLSRNEIYNTAPESEQQGKEIVTIKEKAVAVYKAIFVKNYTSYDYRCFVGNCEFNAETKTFLLRLVSLLSKYSKYE